jgi:predicted DsbA family dithiol-disulfide isomerase
LHPDTPAEGRVRDAAGQARSQAAGDRLREIGEREGIHFEPRAMIANSRKSLEAAEFARDAAPEAFAVFNRRLFKAYFEEGENIGLVDVLVRLGEECGLDAAALREALESGAYGERVDRDVDAARRAGISGTPTYIIDDRYAVVGAQEYEVLEQVMEKIGVPRRDGG